MGGWGEGCGSWQGRGCCDKWRRWKEGEGGWWWRWVRRAVIAARGGRMLLNYFSSPFTPLSPSSPLGSSRCAMTLRHLCYHRGLAPCLLLGRYRIWRWVCAGAEHFLALMPPLDPLTHCSVGLASGFGTRVPMRGCIGLAGTWIRGGHGQLQWGVCGVAGVV